MIVSVTNLYLLQGQYEVSRTSCEKCPAGKYNNQTGESGDSSCKDCADGYVADSEGSETCTQCQPVSYSQLSLCSLLISKSLC